MTGSTFQQRDTLRLDCERYQRDVSQLSREIQDLRQQLSRIPLVEAENRKVHKSLFILFCIMLLGLLVGFYVFYVNARKYPSKRLGEVPVGVEAVQACSMSLILKIGAVGESARRRAGGAAKASPRYAPNM